MVRTWLCLTTALVIASMAIAASADEAGIGTVTLSSGESGALPILQGGEAPVLMSGNASKPKLYDNTAICTVNVQAIALGGAATPSPALSPRDWFKTSGGRVTGFDLYLFNGGSASAVPNHIAQLQFYEGTNSTQLGTDITTPVLAFFRTTGAPLLSPVPVLVDGLGRPKMIKVSVDYDAKTYQVTDADTGVSLIAPSVQDIGTRPSFVLPSGNVGVQVRMGGEASLCTSPANAPVCGPVLASGGSGTEDGMHIINAELAACDPSEYALLCDDPGWGPVDGADRVPCTGGDICSLDLPFFGIAITLYMGPSEDVGGNNEKVTADTISAPIPSGGNCTSAKVFASGFVGDNGESYTGTPIEFFDNDGDNDVDLLDWQQFQNCFGATVASGCEIHDADQDGDVDLTDYDKFDICSANINDPACSGIDLDPPVLLADVDLFKVAVTPGNVMQILVEGDKSPTLGAIWDPYLRVFLEQGGVLTETAVSDDYERQSLDGYTTVLVPPGVSMMYLGISSASNASYDPESPVSIQPIAASDAGGYTITIGVVDPDCVVDNHSGNPTQVCYVTSHEPDDMMADADARGAVNPNDFARIFGALGDGSFSAYGQDFDLYRIELNNNVPSFPLANTRSISASVRNRVSGGFDTVFDMTIGLYNSAGELLATGDQASQSALNLFDQSRPLMAANVLGSNVGGDGIYYLAIFGNDRGLFDEAGEVLNPAIPPSLINFPHGVGVAATEDADLRPLVGGRVNKIGTQLIGREPPNDGPPASPTLQCYKLQILTSNAGLVPLSPDTCDDLIGDGDDSLPTACASLTAITSRLAGTGGALDTFTLGNGRFGGHQGDVDFYALNTVPGQLIAVNVSDAGSPAEAYNVRSYLSLYKPDGLIWADHDYSLEYFEDHVGTPDDVVSEISSTVVGTVPPGVTLSYLMVGIDNGNLVGTENVPFDADLSGTTLSRRFETDLNRKRAYHVNIAVMNHVAAQNSNLRLFATPARGVDAKHVNCFIDSLSTTDNGSTSCYPPLLELDPSTGDVVNIYRGGNFYTPYRQSQNILDPPTEFLPANVVPAYDGTNLYISLERCLAGISNPCQNLDHPLYRINPDKQLGESGYIVAMGQILGMPSDAEVTGMAEKGGNLYALNAVNNTFRYWNKASNPTVGNGGTTVDLTTLIVPGPLPHGGSDVDDVYGDMAGDGTLIYAVCELSDNSAGICGFSHDAGTNTTAVAAFIPDPVTHTGMSNGPVLGGIAVIDGGATLIASDAQGPVIQYYNHVADTVTGLELPTEFFVVKLSARLVNPPQ